MERVMSAVGLVAMVGLACLMSQNFRLIRWKMVVAGIGLQFVIAFVLIGPISAYGLGRPMELAGDSVTWLLNQVDVGAGFVFGDGFREHFVAFKVLPTIIFFSALMSALFHLGVIQRVVQAIGWVMQYTLGTSGAESLSAAANIFVGQTEAPLVIKPYLPDMTRSELNSVMVGGFATVAGGVMAAYIDMGISARHLMTASLISAPAALVIAKIIQPETEVPKTTTTAVVELPDEHKTVNVVHALSVGASDGMKLALNVGAMLIAFLALVAVLNAGIVNLGLMLNSGLQWISPGSEGSWTASFGQGWSLSGALSYLFYPLAILMGIESADAFRVGELLGLRTAANEFIAYQKMSEWIRPDSGVVLSARSQLIATYALCGFANLSSIGIQIGGIGEMAPQRKPTLAELGFRAMLGGTIACFMTACVAGILA